jgi:hypothetical protein
LIAAFSNLALSSVDDIDRIGVYDTKLNEIAELPMGPQEKEIDADYIKNKKEQLQEYLRSKYRESIARAFHLLVEQAQALVKAQLNLKSALLFGATTNNNALNVAIARLKERANEKQKKGIELTDDEAAFLGVLPLEAVQARMKLDGQHARPGTEIVKDLLTRVDHLEAALV